MFSVLLNLLLFCIAFLTNMNVLSNFFFLYLIIYYVKAHPKEQPPTEASTVMDVTDCPKIPDDCETFSWHGDVQWCDQFNKECPRQLRG